MSIQLKLVKHYRVLLIRKPLIGSVMAGGGGGGASGGHSALYAISTEEIGFTNRIDDAFYQEGFVIVRKTENPDHQVFVALKDVHSVEFIPVYDETSL